MNNQKENKMGVMPINKLLLSMSVPMMISMLVQALYNVVDSIFVAQINEAALTAVSLAFPMQNLMIALAVGMGVGVNANLSRFLGQKDFKSVNKTAGNGIVICLISYLLFLLLGFTVTQTFFVAQAGPNETQIIEYGVSYLTICCVCSFGCFLQVMLERLLQSTGKTMYTMLAQGTGAIVNIILDPILIFGLFGFPRMEVAGAALATVAGQIAGAALALIFNVKCNKEIRVSFRDFIPCRHIFGKIFSVGIPSTLMAAMGSVMTFAMNKILVAFSTTAVAVFGVYFKLQSFIFMPVFGLNNGMVPIVSYNYGAQKKSRITKTILYSVFYAAGIMTIGLLIFQIFPELLLNLFDASEDMIAIGVPALRTISTCFLFASVSIVFISVFQAMGSGVFSMFISFTRQLIFLVPCAFLLSKTRNVNLVWLSFPIAECGAIILSTLGYRSLYRRVIAPLGDSE
ncbi:MAG: MATE family efflux transporter [Ruminococcaceae bacterium]|nr:MATE family efflux transporter [Oscillospiraceae bacterium]